MHDHSDIIINGEITMDLNRVLLWEVLVVVSHDENLLQHLRCQHLNGRLMHHQDILVMFSTYIQLRTGWNELL